MDNDIYAGSQTTVPRLVSEKNRLTETEANCAGPPDGYEKKALRASVMFCITVRHDNRPSCSITNTAQSLMNTTAVSNN